ncbi:MAG: metallophosphoesterase family protein [bacterium]
MKSCTIISCLGFILFANFGFCGISLGPYLQPTDDLESSVGIALRTENPATAEIKYGLNSINENSLTTTVTTTKHYIKLTGLAQGKRYLYQIKADGDSSKVYSFKTSPSNGNFKLLIRADEHAMVDDKWTTRQWGIDTMINFGTDIVISAGDVTDKSLPAEYEALLKTNQELYATAIYCPTPGNHDGWGDSAYLDYFYLPENGETGVKEQHYYFNYGNVLFISVNDWAKSFPSSGWIGNIINQARSAGKANFVVLFKHYQVFVNNDSDGDETTITSDRKKDVVVGMCDLYDIDMVFSGHRHHYQRTYPVIQDKSNTTQPKIVYSGKSSYDGSSKGTIYHEINSTWYQFANPVPDPLFAANGIALTQNKSRVLGFTAVDVKGPVWEQNTLNYYWNTPDSFENVDKFIYDKSAFTRAYIVSANNSRVTWSFANPLNFPMLIRYSTESGIKENSVLNIYNCAGRIIKTFSNWKITDHVTKEVFWDGMDKYGKFVQSGQYIFELQMHGRVEVKRVILLR